MEKKSTKENVKQEAVLKVGDVVCLKSGGPPMVIDNIEKSCVRVVWFTCERTETHFAVCNSACLAAVKME